ncbi:hypothetical protein ACWCPQ_34295 [Nocardia sp. NPDC001965]
MQTKTILDILGAIVVVALVTTVVTSAQSAAVIGAFGDAFSGSIKAAMGK